MSRSYEIEFLSTGVSDTSETFLTVAAAMREAAAAQEHLNALGAVEIRNPGLARAATQYDRYAESVRKSTEAIKEAQSAQANLQATVPAGPVAAGAQVGSRAHSGGHGKGPAERLAEAEKELTEALAAGVEERIFDAKVAKERAKQAYDRAVQLLNPDPEPAPEFRFMKGPEQRLLEIERQREALDTVSDPRQREAIEKDLNRSERLARRSILLDERRQQNPQLMQGPGLLELFAEMNGLLKNLQAGNMVGFTQSLFRGIDLVRTGGLSAEQILARANAPGERNVEQRTNFKPLPQIPGFDPDRRGAFNSADLLAGHARLLDEQRKSWGIGEGITQIPAWERLWERISGPAGFGQGLNEFLLPGQESSTKIPLTLTEVVRNLKGLTGPLLLAGFAATVFAGSALYAGKRIGEAGRAGTESGGSSFDVAGLNALGIAPGQVAGTAASFRQRASSDPWAMQAMAQLGLPQMMPQQFGSQNNAKILLDTLDALRKVTDAEEQLRLARMLGLEASLDLVRVSDDIWRSQKRLADAQGTIRDDKATQAARDMNTALRQMGEAAALIPEVLGKPFIKTVTDLANWETRVLTDTARVLDSVGNPLLKLLTLQHVEFKDFEEGWKKLVDGKNSAEDEHTQALREHSRVLREGYSGGGARTRGAMPADIRGEMLRQAIAGNSLRLGAFTP